MSKEKKSIVKVLQLIVVVIVVIIIALILRNRMISQKNVSSTNNTNITNTEPVQEEVKKTGTRLNDGKYSEKQKDGSIVNTSEKLKETKRFTWFEISDMKLVYKDGKTTFTSKVKNLSTLNLLETYLNVYLYKSEEEEYLKVGGMIPCIDAKGEETFTVDFINEDVSDIYDIKFEPKTLEEYKEIYGNAEE